MSKVPVYAAFVNEDTPPSLLVAEYDINTSPPYEQIEMGWGISMDRIVNTEKRRVHGKWAWVVVVRREDGDRAPAVDMSIIIGVAIKRGCQWASPWNPGEDLKVLLPNGAVREYTHGDEIDIASLERELKRIGH